MNPSRSSSRSIRRALRACSLALLALGLLAPSAAKAEHCGRYVLGEARFERELAQLLGGESGRSPLAPIPPAPPCTGASCSGQPAAPATPVATPTPPVEDWAHTIASPAIEPTGPLAIVADEAESRPIRRERAIFHPPRRPA